MEHQLHDILLEGEVIRWCGRPAPFKLMDLPSRNFLIFTWVTSGMVLGLILGLCIATFSRTLYAPLDFSILLLAMLLLPLMAAFRPILDRRCLLRNTIYAITNCRVIAKIKDDVIYVPLTRDLKTASLSHRGHFGSLCFGEAVSIAPHRELSAAIIGIRNVGDIANPSVAGIILYHLRNPEDLLHYLA